MNFLVRFTILSFPYKVYYYRATYRLELKLISRWVSKVGIATRLRAGRPGRVNLIHEIDNISVSPPALSGRLCYLPSMSFNGYWDWSKAAGA